ncbi:MAG: redox-sensing transcriptional repressor Rex [Sedimentisphaerales bacterium]|nr:redox-sensing transcriptional repressor Rex [Sedimentisphaerales bacterium]
MSEIQEINRLTLDRLIRYYYWISEYCDPSAESAISSAQLARELSLDDSQIRKDLAAIGLKGHCHVGFDIRQVVDAIRQALGLTQTYRAVVLGAGRLGGAISSYGGFARFGLDIVALFDNDAGKIGLMIGGQVVQPLDHLESVVRQTDCRLGILTVPAEAARSCADRLIGAGIRVLWNFSPVHLHHPEHVFVRDERLFVALAELFYYLNRLESDPPPAGPAEPARST